MANTPETAEKRAIKQWLAFDGWFVYHNLAGIGVYPGVADLTAIKNGNVVQIEVKVGKYKQSARQLEFEQEWIGKGGYYFAGDLDGLCEYLNRIGLHLGGLSKV
jgi:Holliday junction resolvase